MDVASVARYAKKLSMKDRSFLPTLASAAGAPGQFFARARSAGGEGNGRAAWPAARHPVEYGSVISVFRVQAPESGAGRRRNQVLRRLSRAGEVFRRAGDDHGDGPHVKA